MGKGLVAHSPGVQVPHDRRIAADSSSMGARSLKSGDEKGLVDIVVT